MTKKSARGKGEEIILSLYPAEQLWCRGMGGSTLTGKKDDSKKVWASSKTTFIPSTLQRLADIESSAILLLGFPLILISKNAG
jgi:hypothetical protein